MKKTRTPAAQVLKELASGKISTTEQLQISLSPQSEKPVLLAIVKQETVHLHANPHTSATLKGNLGKQTIPLSEWPATKAELEKRFTIVQITILSSGPAIANHEAQVVLN